MSVEHIAAVLHHSRATGAAKLVLIGIANHAGDGGAWPSLATLAKYAGVTPRNVRKHLRALEELGELRCHVQAGGTAGQADYQRPNRYDVLVSCPPWCDRSAAHRDQRERQQPLWTNPRSVATPPVGSDPRPRSVATPAPRSVATPKPSYRTPMAEVGSSVTGPRASTDTCDVCSQPEAECQRRAATSGHAFTPKLAG